MKIAVVVKRLQSSTLAELEDHVTMDRILVSSGMSHYRVTEEKVLDFIC